MELTSCYMVQNGAIRSNRLVLIWWRCGGTVVQLWQLEINEARKTDGAGVVEVWKSVESVVE